MAFCMNFDQLKAGPANVTGAAGGGQPYVPLAVVQATKTGDDYSCAAGGYLLLTVEEVNAQAAQSNTSDPLVVADLQSLFYMFLAVLVSVWAIKRLLDLFSGEGDK